MATAAVAKPATLRAAIKANHLDALKRNARTAKAFDRLAADLKADVRRLVAEKRPGAAKVAADKFAVLAAAYAADVAAFVRREAERTMREVMAALARAGQPPPPPAVVAPLVAQVAPPPDEHQRKADALILFGLLGMLSAGVAAAVAGGMTSAPGAEIAVDHLANRAKRLARYGTVRVVNRATRVAVEAVVPVAKPLRPGVLIPVARRAPEPIPIRGRPEPEPRGPFPHEPEFIILPTSSPVPVDPAQPPPPRDPDPLSPIPTASNLIGWQVLGILDNRIRPKHRHRHGDTFYYHPRPERNERGMDECPNPPYESPRDGNTLAYNCRCRIVPLFGE